MGQDAFGQPIDEEDKLVLVHPSLVEQLRSANNLLAAKQTMLSRELSRLVATVLDSSHHEALELAKKLRKLGLG